MGPKRRRGDASRRHAVEIPPELVDAEFPPRALVRDRPLHHGEGSGFEALPMVFERAFERGHARETVFDEVLPELVLRIETRLDPSEQFQHMPAVGERHGVRRVVPAPRPRDRRPMTAG
jgi:hypothetical protein